jgi:hypothetical protein
MNLEDFQELIKVKFPSSLAEYESMKLGAILSLPKCPDTISTHPKQIKE